MIHSRNLYLFLFAGDVLPALLISPSICRDRVFKVSVVWDKGRHLFYIHKLFVFSELQLADSICWIFVLFFFSFPEVHMLFAGMQRDKVRFENWPYGVHRAEVRSEVSE